MILDQPHLRKVRHVLLAGGSCRCRVRLCPATEPRRFRGIPGRARIAAGPVVSPGARDLPDEVDSLAACPCPQSRQSSRGRARSLCRPCREPPLGFRLAIVPSPRPAPRRRPAPHARLPRPSGGSDLPQCPRVHPRFGDAPPWPVITNPFPRPPGSDTIPIGRRPPRSKAGQGGAGQPV